MKKFVLIDGNAIIHRAYHSIPKNFTNRKGEKINAVYGFAMTLIKVLEDLKPEFLAASFDLAGPTFRHKEYKEYKATRVKADQDLYDQIPRIKELVERLGVPIYEKEGFEADDCLGTITSKIQDTRNKDTNKNQSKLAKNISGDDLDTYIVSGDKDIFQLINGRVKVYNLRKGLSQTQIVDKKYVEKEYDLQPEDFIDLKALAGDSSDNIPGVPGIGQVTATKLLQKFDTLEKLYKIIDNGPDLKLEDIKPRILKLLIENKKQAFLSQRLATIKRDVPIDFKLEDCAWDEYHRGKLHEALKELGFQSLLRRFDSSKSGEIKKARNEDKTETENKDSQPRLL